MLTWSHYFCYNGPIRFKWWFKWISLNITIIITIALVSVTPYVRPFKDKNSVHILTTFPHASWSSTTISSETTGRLTSAKRFQCGNVQFITAQKAFCESGRVTKVSVSDVYVNCSLRTFPINYHYTPNLTGRNLYYLQCTFLIHIFWCWDLLFHSGAFEDLGPR